MQFVEPPPVPKPDEKKSKEKFTTIVPNARDERRITPSRKLKYGMLKKLLNW
jgi:hypothetical protein